MAEDGVTSKWRDIFKRYNILEEVDKKGFFKITANQIKEYKEPRLMTKFDEYSQMPDSFTRHGLSIISDSRGTYIIGRFAVFTPVNYKNQESKPVEPLFLESLSIDNLYSESSSILYAYNSNILKDAFGTDEIAFTTFGRMGAGSFSFDVDVVDKNRKPTGKKKTIEVTKPQIEIDGAFETEDAFYIIEAKNRYVEDMNLRQLYYPFRFWSSKISKKVVPVFLVYSDKSFYVYVCSFQDTNNINSFKVERFLKFAPAAEPITMPDVVDVFNGIKPSSATYLSIFPQADRMEKILDLLNILDADENATKDDITKYFGFDPRQTDYYLNAAAFIGLVKIEKRKSIGLSDKGKDVMKMDTRERNLQIISSILQDQVFYQTFDYLLKHRELPEKEFVSKLIQKYYPPKKNGDQTPGRRAQTVLSWINWIVEFTNP